MGSTSVFLATEDLPRVHCSETAFRTFLLHGSLLCERPYDQTNKTTSAPSEDSDQPGHPPSLIRVFAVRMKKHWVLSYPLWWWMPWLIWDFAGRTGHFVCFVVLRLICRTPARVDPTGRPIPTTVPILHIDLVIWRLTITWAEISATTSQKTKLLSHKVNSTSSICFSLIRVCLFVLSGTSINIHILIYLDLQLCLIVRHIG